VKGHPDLPKNSLEQGPFSEANHTHGISRTEALILVCMQDWVVFEKVSDTDLSRRVSLCITDSTRYYENSQTEDSFMASLRNFVC
jgi:hypothetical protein